MIHKIIIFYLVIFILLKLLLKFSDSKLSFLAFTWLGPLPTEGEFLSSFKLRKVAYAFSWLLQFLFAICLLLVISHFYENIDTTNVYLLFIFGIGLGLGISFFATLGFLLSWLKTVVIGGNPQFEIYDEEKTET